MSSFLIFTRVFDNMRDKCLFISEIHRWTEKAREIIIIGRETGRICTFYIRSINLSTPWLPQYVSSSVKRVRSLNRHSVKVQVALLWRSLLAVDAMTYWKWKWSRCRILKTAAHWAHRPLTRSVAESVASTFSGLRFDFGCGRMVSIAANECAWSMKYSTAPISDRQLCQWREYRRHGCRHRPSSGWMSCCVSVHPRSASVVGLVRLWCRHGKR